MASHHQIALGHHSSRTDQSADCYRAQVLTSSSSSGFSGTEGSSYATTLLESQNSNSWSDRISLGSSISPLDDLTHIIDSSSDEILRGSSEGEDDDDWSSADERGFSMAPDTSDDDHGGFNHRASGMDPTRPSIMGVASARTLLPPVAFQPTNSGEESDEEDEEDEEDDDDAVFARLMAKTAQLRNNTGSSNTALPADTAEVLGDVQHHNHPEVGPTEIDRVADMAAKPAQQARRSKAIAYLESVPLDFLKQLERSVKALNIMESRPKRATKPKPRRKGSSHDEEDEVPNRGGEGRSFDWEDVGVVMELKNRQTGTIRKICFPDESPGPGPRTNPLDKMACVMRIAAVLYEAVLSGTIVTKRDIYYRDVALFKSQVVVDKLVDDMVATAGLRRGDFNVCADAKGLMASRAAELQMHTGDCIKLSSNMGTLIPPIERIAEVSLLSEIDYVLVVEKDAVFQTLCSTGFLEDPRLGIGILLTGKGYPDLSTIQMLAHLAKKCPAILTLRRATFFALVDADPHGIDILSVYTTGSKASRFSTEHEGLALGDRLKWLGVKATDWSTLGVEHDDLLPLTDRDVILATSMLRDRADMPATWRRELQQILHLDRKAEIQIVSGVMGGNGQSNPKTDALAHPLVEYIVSGMLRHFGRPVSTI